MKMTVKKVLGAIMILSLLLSMAACADTGADSDILSPNAAGSDLTGQAGAGDATVQETVLVEGSGIKITAKSISYDDLFGPELKILIENSTDKDLTVQTRSASVNGYMVETMLSADVAAGKKANDAITFLNTDLEACGIGTLADMEFSFHVFTTDDWETYLDTEPIQLKTSAAETYTYTYDQEGTLVYEGNGVKLVVKGLSEDGSIFGPGLVVYIHNENDKSVTVQTRDASVNGFMMDPLFSAEVAAGKHAISSVTFMDSELEENGITQITEIELSFHIYDTESWDTIVDTDPVSVSFN